ncbi:hypothetical protein [Actinoplanes sp. NPDC026619]|uniref:hypothetical protein n=1 Tax=Actinoplanes sp. NPDC026619 TaxID=3155798 RepID=UPI0033E42995
MDRRRRIRLARGGGAALALLLAATVGVLAASMKKGDAKEYNYAVAPAWSPPVAGPSPTTPAPTSPSAVPTTPIRSSAAAVQLPATANFEVAATAGSVTVRSQDLGANLYRVTLAKAPAPVTAKITDSGSNHRLTLVKDVKTTAPPVTILLNARIRWSLRMTAGNTDTTVNLTGARLTSLELAGGAHVFDLSLPPITGTLPLRLTHGMNQLKIKSNDSPVRMTLRIGAGKVIMDGVIFTDTTPGKVITSAGWEDSSHRVDLDAAGGVGTLVVNTD